MPINFFKLLNLPQTFVMGEETLERAYLKAQQQTHPDSPEAMKSGNASAEMAAALNEAYTVLKNPVSRAAHLLEVTTGTNPLSPTAEATAPTPQNLLLRQFAWQEEREEAETQEALTALRLRAKQAAANLEKAFSRAYEEKNLEEATNIAREMAFVRKFMLELKS